MSTDATPAVPAGGTPPAVPAATPSNEQQGETVTLKKEEVEQLRRDAARASEAQSRADRFEGIAKKHGLLGGGHFKPAAPVTPPTPEERQAAGAEEDRKAERGLMALAVDPAYREVLDSDPTLRNLLVKNPLAVLPILAEGALDADDALALVKESLDKRKPTPTPPATPPAPAPATPPMGGVNPPSQEVNADVEAARKLPNTERAVAGMVGARLKSMIKK